jgi:hypothetical protein
MKASIVRLEQTEDGAIGVLLLDSIIFCYTLQPDSLDTKKFSIPEGEYIAKRFHGTKWPDTFEVVGEGTKGHTALLFHAGNTEVDTLGCTLLGSSVNKLKGFRAVSNSGLTFKLFLEATKTLSEFPLTIKDCYL